MKEKEIKCIVTFCFLTFPSFKLKLKPLAFDIGVDSVFKRNAFIEMNDCVFCKILMPM